MLPHSIPIPRKMGSPVYRGLGEDSCQYILGFFFIFTCKRRGWGQAGPRTDHGRRTMVASWVGLPGQGRGSHYPLSPSPVPPPNHAQASLLLRHSLTPTSGHPGISHGASSGLLCSLSSCPRPSRQPLLSQWATLPTRRPVISGPEEPLSIWGKRGRVTPQDGDSKGTVGLRVPG